jgi:transcriptional regulator with XRE-family HTH domain
MEMDFGKSIKLLRISAGLKQEDLAAKLGVTSNYISLIENNKREPSLSFLRGLADELDIPLGVLFLEVDKSRFVDKPEKRILLSRIRDLLFDIERLRLQEEASRENGS